MTGDVGVGPSFLDEWDEEGASEAVDVGGVVDGVDGACVGVACDGGASSDDADGFGMGDLEGHLRGGFDDAEDGDIEGFLEFVECVGACGIAGDDDGFDAAIDELFGARGGVSDDGLRSSIAVWDAGGIAEVDEIFARHGLTQGVEDGEPADAAIEDADGS